jgi:cell division protein FtsZ
VGGAGGNIINSMIESGIEGVDFLNVNTDSQQLKHSKVEKTLQLGPSCTEGLGAGADPELGKKAAEEVIDEIEQYLQDANMVFLTAGMGGGTGTGASPVIARVAKEKGILTVGVVTKPFEMEGNRKINRADEGDQTQQRYVDNLIVIPNQNIFHLARPDTPVIDSLQFANDVLIDGVKSIIDLMVKPGIMNHDFADVKAIMSETGKVHLGTGIAEGEDRINAATDSAISNTLCT